jgi:quercetin 2,3-dioxygenase
MIRLRKAAERGHADHGWLKTHHTFSFAGYRDPAHVHFRALRVMNEDVVAPGQGFGEHPHQDMEIVTYILAGALEHKDSMGNGEILRPGEFQRMSAGTGILHSEFNPSTTDPTHLYQIWLFPQRKGLAPSYQQKSFPEAGRHNRWQLVASPDAAEGSLEIHTDARIFLAMLDSQNSLTHAIAADRHAWLQVLRGTISIADQPLTAGDGAAVSDERSLDIRANSEAEVMLFDLA